jgi:hypothetical protein
MNVKYLAKNPTPVTQTITLRQGIPLGDSGICSAEAITVQVPPMSVREILFDQNGMPLVEGCMQDLTVTLKTKKVLQLTHILLAVNVQQFATSTASEPMCLLNKLAGSILAWILKTLAI